MLEGKQNDRGCHNSWGRIVNVSSGSGGELESIIITLYVFCMLTFHYCFPIPIVEVDPSESACTSFDLDISRSNGFVGESRQTRITQWTGVFGPNANAFPLRSSSSCGLRRVSRVDASADARTPVWSFRFIQIRWGDTGIHSAVSSVAMK